MYYLKLLDTFYICILLLLFQRTLPQKRTILDKMLLSSTGACSPLRKAAAHDNKLRCPTRGYCPRRSSDPRGKRVASPTKCCSPLRDTTLLDKIMPLRQESALPDINVVPPTDRCSRQLAALPTKSSLPDRKLMPPYDNSGREASEATITFHSRKYPALCPFLNPFLY